MQITFSETAKDQIERSTINESVLLKLAYDSEGCGCSLDGLAQLWIVDAPKGSEVFADCDSFQILINPQNEVLFEDKLTIDYQSSKLCYSLKSDNQIYNANMSIVDKRKKK